MRPGAGPRPRLLLLLLLAQQALPGGGNQGSVAGSCLCDVRFPSGRQMQPAALAQIRRKLESLTRCPFFIRFQLQSGTRVCGGSREPWVHDLVSCLERHECGNGGGKISHHREHSPHASTRVPKATEGLPPDTSTPAQTQRTQQGPPPSGAPSSTSSPTTHHPETTTVTSAYALEAESEAKAKEKQQDKQQGKPASVTGTAALVPVLSLLAITFLLTAALLYVLCKRRVTRQRPADGQLHYEPVNQAPRA